MEDALRVFVFSTSHQLTHLHCQAIELVARGKMASAVGITDFLLRKARGEPWNEFQGRASNSSAGTARGAMLGNTAKYNEYVAGCRTRAVSR